MTDLLADTVGGVWGQALGVDAVDVSVVRSTEFAPEGKLRFETAARRSVPERVLERRALRAGDILLEKSGGGPNQPVGRVAYIETAPDRVLFSNFVQLLRPSVEIEPQWLFYVLWLTHAHGETLEFQTQTTGIRNLRTKDYLARKISVPPLRTQRRIADLVGTFDDAIDAADREARSFRVLARALRNGILTDPAWEEVELSEAVEVTMGRQRSPKHQTGDHIVPYLRAANVKDGYLHLDDVLSMNFTLGEQEKYALKPGDVLVTEGCGSLSQIGASARWAAEIDGVVCFQNTLLRLRAIPQRTLPEYVDQWARWAFEQGAFAAVASGTSIFHIGSRGACQMPFACPPLEAQARSVAVLGTADGAAAAAEQQRTELEQAKLVVLDALCSGMREIGSNYDRFLSEDRHAGAAKRVPA